MKKIISAVLVAALAAGCVFAGGKKESAGSGEKHYKFGFTCMDQSNPFFVLIEKTIREEVEKRGDKLVSVDPANNVTRQIQQVEDVIAQKVDGFFMNPAEAEGIIPALDQLKAAGIPIVNFDTEVADMSYVATYTGSDNYNAGKVCGEDLVKKCPNGGDMATYYVKMSGNNRWRGNLKTLRLDPTNGGSFELDSIEILQNDPKFPILVDGKALQTYGVPQHDGGSVLIPAHPAYSTFTVLGADYDWNKSAGILTVNGHSHTVVFTVGSKDALVDGEKQTLDTAVTLFDGLPLIPYDFLASSLGCMTSLTGENLTIVTDFAG